jgi:hypothetical protein
MREESAVLALAESGFLADKAGFGMTNGVIFTETDPLLEYESVCFAVRFLLPSVRPEM